MVNSFAAMSARKPTSRKVEDVTGPIEANRIPLRLLCAAPSKAMKLRAVEELVKVTTWGRLSGFFSAFRSRTLEDFGTTVS